MQAWVGKQGEQMTLGQTGLKTGVVVVWAENGECEILIPDWYDLMPKVFEEAKRRAAGYRHDCRSILSD